MLRRWIVRNWLILTVGLNLTALAVRFAYIERGYIAIGSEWLVLPFLFFLRKLFQSIMEDAGKW